jgi:hypothetical protein
MDRSPPRAAGQPETRPEPSGYADAGPAARAWAEALASWAIPDHIAAAAPEPPWTCSPTLFASSAERSMAPDFVPTPSRQKAREALPEGGTVLDVGVGGGAASLPLCPPAGMVVGVDENPGMLEVFAAAADRLGTAHREVEGAWPAVADRVEAADVVVCHHVLYNVADLGPFAAALTGRARRRVVVELSAEHPLARLNPLWKTIHGLDRPSDPTAAGAVAVLEESGLAPRVEESTVTGPWGSADRAAIVRFSRRKLCVGPEWDAEIDAVLGDPAERPPRRIVTIWWDGTAR